MKVMNSFGSVPVVVGEFNIVSRSQDLAVLQPNKVRLGDTLGHAGEHSAAT